MKTISHTISVIFSLLSFIIVSLAQAQEAQPTDFNCFSILIGKNATVDGSVMFAHNEDDWGDRIVNFYKVPASTHKPVDSIVMKNGGKMEQAKETWSYTWLEIPELEFSDSYINQWGVTIASDACVSREKEPELTDGGIGYRLRRAMAERAKSAREAVKIGGALIDKYGYSSSGRTYCIADPNEAWMLSVVKGKHWIAQRVPDDHVAIIPNYYTITKINIYDTMNFYGSPDLFEYGIEKGWFDPVDPGDFNFREIYSDQGNLESMGNIVRHWSSINMLADKHYDINDDLPFSFKPKEKVTLKMLYEVLRNHNEGTEYDKSENYTKGNPHEQGRTICSNSTQYGFVAQLRQNMPNDIGVLLWLAPFRPCVHPFTPWYFGMTEMPEGFAEGNYKSALENHFDKIDDVYEFAKDNKFLEFVEHAKKIDENYKENIEEIKKQVSEYETKLIKNQSSFEYNMIELYSKNPKQSKKAITEYSLEQIRKAREMAGLK